MMNRYNLISCLLRNIFDDPTLPPLKKQKVLVIDNDPDTVEIISVVLQEEIHLDVIGLENMPDISHLESISLTSLF